MDSYNLRDVRPSYACQNVDVLVSVCLMNDQSLNNIAFSVIDFVVALGIDILTLTLVISESVPESYNFFTFLVKKIRGCGVAMTINTIKIYRPPPSEQNGF